MQLAQSVLKLSFFLRSVVGAGTSCINAWLEKLDEEEHRQRWPLFFALIASRTAECSLHTQCLNAIPLGLRGDVPLGGTSEFEFWFVMEVFAS
mmetsp:Transcript_99428/g.197007  ORF Transcript_99428/g.197007 Transcript_99428/m.197007 type:complete len:93 (+) Transcript_99428:142-420(+)